MRSFKPLSLRIPFPSHTLSYTPSLHSFSATPKRAFKSYSTSKLYLNSPIFRTNHSESTSIPPRSRFRRFIGFTSIAVFAFTVGLTYQTQLTLSRIMATPTEEETLTAFIANDPATAKIDNTLRTHPVAEALRADPEFSESRPHLTIPGPLRERNLTAGTLAGPGKIVVPPYVFSERDGKSMISLMYLGGDVCGHQGIIHGGLLATLLDEGLARCCFPALPNKVGVTANLNIDYRSPAMANQYVALRAETVKVEGRKAWVEGRIETLPVDGKEPLVLVEAKALFIEPRQAAALSSLYKVA
ncbi:Thioesterase superfamily [Penicillium cf. griseofulvum]|uniref:Thioesterase superfamily n=1 Tax=Penicillium cf. griseofulvum TaxID=2972120 RepID=A0A9W9IXP1_9EURO|nr:Thioesterase superfamily [Penicillium cf. griseofulvum]KAJ5436568.1 Thioesterase superfamily [Penicillium cf. griseofulvum]